MSETDYQIGVFKMTTFDGPIEITPNAVGKENYLKEYEAPVAKLPGYMLKKTITGDVGRDDIDDFFCFTWYPMAEDEACFPGYGTALQEALNQFLGGLKEQYDLLMEEDEKDMENIRLELKRVMEQYIQKL